MDRTPLKDARYWIETLGLETHIEGGAFKEIYRAALQLPANSLPAGFGASRSVATGIYFLLQKGQFSAFHRIKSDETWHFYYGDPLVVYEIDGNGILTEHHLGSDPAAGQQFQATIMAGNWFAAKVAGEGQYSLTGCTVSPGFDFADFELANREALIALHPQHAGLIKELSI